MKNVSNLQSLAIAVIVMGLVGFVIMGDFHLGRASAIEEQVRNNEQIRIDYSERMRELTVLQSEVLLLEQQLTEGEAQLQLLISGETEEVINPAEEPEEPEETPEVPTEGGGEGFH